MPPNHCRCLVYANALAPCTSRSTFPCESPNNWCADYFQHESFLARDQGGQRVATMLMYLSTVPLNGGGETTFPKAKSGNVRGLVHVYGLCFVHRSFSATLYAIFPSLI
jgi:hypothetical protein